MDSHSEVRKLPKLFFFPFENGPSLNGRYMILEGNKFLPVRADRLVCNKAYRNINEDTQEMHNHEAQPSHGRLGASNDEINVTYPASILYKSIAGHYRPVSYPDGPITARYRFM